MTLASILISVMLSFILSLIFCGAMVRFGPKDAPDGARKVQKTAVASAGGIAIFFAVVLLLAGMGILNATGAQQAFVRGIGMGILPHILLVLGAFGIGAWDDILGMQAKVKLIIIAALCFFASGAGFYVQSLIIPGTQIVFDLNPVLAIIGSALWLLVLINAVNFMDGSNGFAPGMMLISFSGLGWLFLFGTWSGVAGGALLGVLCFMVAAALAGLLVWNLSDRLYMGDTGALFLGAVFGSLALYGIQFAPNHPDGPAQGLAWLPAAMVLPILMDVLLTLVWRHHKQQDLLSAHREHAYQWMLRRGVRPLYVALSGWSLTALCTVSILALPPLIGEPTKAGQAQSAGLVFLLLVAGLSAGWTIQRKLFPVAPPP